MGEDDITYSDLKILQHQQQPIKWSRGSVSCNVLCLDKMCMQGLHISSPAQRFYQSRILSKACFSVLCQFSFSLV